MAILLIFFVLQCCDMATTLVFLRHGVPEGNPLVSAAIHLSSHPAIGLGMLKVLGCGLGILAYRGNRRRLLRRINMLFAACVVWNLAAIALA